MHKDASRRKFDIVMAWSVDRLGRTLQDLIGFLSELRSLGTLLGHTPTNEAEHFIRCPSCGGWMDCRDLGQVFEHEGPLPHPAQDQPQ
jgi:hypothetical protein